MRKSYCKETKSDNKLFDQIVVLMLISFIMTLIGAFGCKKQLPGVPMTFTPDMTQIAISLYTHTITATYTPTDTSTSTPTVTQTATLNATQIQKTATMTAMFVTSWGTRGSGDGQFWNPTGIAIDSGGNGNIYVLDTGNNRIQKFDTNGVFISKWGSGGAGDGQFNHAWGLAIDSSNRVYVADAGNQRIQVFDSSGTFITKWIGCKGLYGYNCMFSNISAVAIGSSGNVWVCNSGMIEISSVDSHLITYAGDTSMQYNFGSIATSNIGDIFISDSRNDWDGGNPSHNRIVKRNSAGSYISWGGSGTGDGQFDYPWGIAVDNTRKVYVADIYNNRIQKFNEYGVYITQWGSYGAGNGEFFYPIGVAVDNSGNVYVTDAYNNRVQKFHQ